ncbi:response regulator [Merismopedia glauca]|uniref:Transcriptional regulator n=1 Tax=Merismopedia glauca CCAP 1448/3 TaxID=1296344 RepID=A0A2T1BY84_9CYAN|nr:response regulator [Merismopedia glauca]PSB00887.1 hypothetical protein C7B64_21135 [Merismopedia glauca CCAP 1448/3]
MVYYGIPLGVLLKCMRILIIEDDQYTAEAFKIALLEASYTVEIATQNLLAWDLLDLGRYDLILLDAASPKLDNLVLYKRLRDKGCHIPVLLMIDSHTNQDIKSGLEVKATDYLIKPFDLEDLTKRIDSLLNQESCFPQSVLSWGALTLNLHNQQLIYAGNQIKLDIKELYILELLFRYNNRVFSFSAILNKIFFCDSTVTKETIKNIIRNLIIKIKKLGINDLIEIVYGRGYRLNSSFSNLGLINIDSSSLEIPLIPYLWIISPDTQFIGKILREAVNWGLKTQVITTLATAITKIGNEPNNVVLLDISASDKTEGLRVFLAELYIKKPLVSVVAFMTEKDIKERLTISDFSHQAVYCKSASSIQILEIVAHTLRQSIIGECKILLIDRNPDILWKLRHLLEPWGFFILTLEDDLRFWETMTLFSPELVILGEFNLQVDAFTICKSVREHPQWATLPIIFLVSNSDDLVISKVFEVGADDFVNKPIIDAELVNRVLSCWDQVKVNRNCAAANLLTDVSNHYESTKDLEKLLHLARRQNQNLSLVILNINNFSEVKKLFGYVGGNDVFRFLVEFLKESLRTEDVVARWGEEFLISMYGINKIDAIERFNQILVKINTQEFMSTNGAKFEINCSIGIAQYPQDGTDINSLYQSTKKNFL